MSRLFALMLRDDCAIMKVLSLSSNEAFQCSTDALPVLCKELFKMCFALHDSLLGCSMRCNQMV